MVTLVFLPLLCVLDCQQWHPGHNNGRLLSSFNGIAVHLESVDNFSFKIIQYL